MYLECQHIIRRKWGGNTSEDEVKIGPKYSSVGNPHRNPPRDKLINICEYIFDNKASGTISLLWTKYWKFVLKYKKCRKDN